MKHLRLFEEYQKFDEYGTAGRDLKSEPPVEGEKFFVPGFVKTETQRSEVDLKPGDVLEVTDVRKRGLYSSAIEIEFETIKGESHRCDLSDFIEMLNYDIKDNYCNVISPEKMMKRFPSWRGKMIGKKFGF